MVFLLKAWGFLKKVPLWLYLAIAGLALSAVIISSIVSDKVERKELRDALKDAQLTTDKITDTRRVDQAVSEHRVETVRIITEKEATERAKTEAVLEANKDWANQPIPPAVRDRLQPNNN